MRRGKSGNMPRCDFPGMISAIYRGNIEEGGNAGGKEVEHPIWRARYKPPGNVKIGPK